MSDSEPILFVKDLAVGYDDFLVANINLELKCGEIIAIAGPIIPKFGNPNQPNVKAPARTICKKQPEIWTIAGITNSPIALKTAEKIYNNQVNIAPPKAICEKLIAPPKTSLSPPIDIKIYFGNKTKNQ